ncbi:MAG: alpha/beta fold hydrolase [Alphaproteobacteria bacterium]
MTRTIAAFAGPFAALALLGFAAQAAETPQRVTRGNLVMEGIPAIPDEMNASLLQYQNARSANFDSWAPGGGILIRTRFAETSQLHLVAAPMGARKQITFFDEPIAFAAYARIPDPKGLLYGKDKGGDENFQIYYRPNGAAKDVQVTVAGTRNTGASLSRDGKRVAWSQQTKDSGLWRIFVASLDKPGDRKEVLAREGAWSVVDWSPDTKTLLVQNEVSITEGHLYLLDIAHGTLKQINKKDQKISYNGALFSPDGKYIVTANDEGREFVTLVRYPVAGGAAQTLSGDINWDVESYDISPNGETYAFVTNEGGVSRIYIRRWSDNSALPGPQLPPGLVFGITYDAASARLAFSFTNAQSSGDVWSYALASRELTRWTESEVGGLDASRFVDPSLVSYPTFDTVDGKRREIPAFVYRPKTKGPHPVLINIHGGPESQARPSFSALIQYWVNELGMAVIVPNVRGSTGYGKTYVDLDNGFKREDSVKDIGALLDWIGTQRDFDSKRISVYGGSYGGYMVYAVMAHYNARIAAAVDIVGISNFITFLENTSGYRRDLRRVEYGDERDPAMRAFLQKISPLTNSTKITKPIFIIQGANDPRVPMSEAEQMLKAVRANGGEAWYLLALDEGHGFQKKANRDFQNAATAMFLKRHVLGQR